MAAPTFVQAGVDDNGGGGNATVVLSVTTGNSIAVFVAFATGRGSATATVADGTNTYNQKGTYNDLAFNGCAMFVAENVTGGSLSIAATITGTPSGFVAISAYEIAASGSYPTVDVYEGTGQSTGADPVQSGAFTTNDATELILVFESNYYVLSSPTGNVNGASLTFPAAGQLNNGTASAGNIASGYVATSSTQTGVVASISPGGTVYGVMFVVAFKANAAAAPAVSAPPPDVLVFGGGI